ncbi:hypothetical protein EYF80_002458 [Liparis tanakae]|uniref:Uncharacterized protein n=1 Tax=Liparis tanakae TaxID=230148 RepID=A0A4Z2JAR7_9TELE|nr:hypothetical protein EYF80_002458 [Liparis tanakae]
MAVPKVITGSEKNWIWHCLSGTVRLPTKYCQQRIGGAHRMRDTSQAKPIMIPARLGVRLALWLLTLKESITRTFPTMVMRLTMADTVPMVITSHRPWGGRWTSVVLLLTVEFRALSPSMVSLCRSKSNNDESVCHFQKDLLRGTRSTLRGGKRVSSEAEEKEDEEQVEGGHREASVIPAQEVQRTASRSHPAIRHSHRASTREKCLQLEQHPSSVTQK